MTINVINTDSPEFSMLLQKAAQIGYEAGKKDASNVEWVDELQARVILNGHRQDKKPVSKNTLKKLRISMKCGVDYKQLSARKFLFSKNALNKIKSLK